MDIYKRRKLGINTSFPPLIDFKAGCIGIGGPAGSCRKHSFTRK
jgi:hypothetical protein